ncbi:MAG TPA: hypothetical protein PLU58_14155 [Saprospiraceae bacterium]|jgi:hypothetical protein|nr:hypothetical protein [Saprospiraceae bacterium]
MEVNVDYLAKDKENLLQAIKIIEKRIIKNKRKSLNPYQISISIRNSIITQKRKLSKVSKDPIPDFIRKFHDFYGWMSKGNLMEVGLCSGAFYRTIEFINIDPTLRSGRKNDKKLEYGIHIEHTIPVASIRSVLFNNVNEQTSPKEIFHMILTYSVCTGFSRINERTNIIKGYNSKHPQISDGKLLSPNEIKPFLRYNKDTVIYSILSGNTVSLDSDLVSINSHLKEYEIFNWEFLESKCSKQ